jgi:hypothetical protein
VSIEEQVGERQMLCPSGPLVDVLASVLLCTGWVMCVIIIHHSSSFTVFLARATKPKGKAAPKTPRGDFQASMVCVIVANFHERCSLFLPPRWRAGPMALML